MQAERKDLESSVVELSGKTTALQRWLAENEAKLPEGQSCLTASAGLPEKFVNAVANSVKVMPWPLLSSLYSKPASKCL